MMRFLEILVVGLAIILTAPTSASAFHCVAQSGNGAVGRADRAMLERAQWVAMRECAAEGGNAGGHHCRIVHCRY
jgi:hypothetical protein